jgi:hypothetical protein
MAATLPPPPVRADNGSFAWVAWYQDLYTLLSTAGSVSWSLVDKAGSSIADLQAKAHNLLTGVLGTGAYHISSAEATTVTTLVGSTYTPTLTNVTNLTASTAYQCQYMRVGSTVTVSGRVDIDPTAAGATELGITLPVASNFGAIEDCAGVAAASGIAGQAAAIAADTANDRAKLVYVAVDLTNQPMYFTFTYQVI